MCVRPSSTYRKPVTGELDAGEGLMARWLNERGYPFEFEPDWGVPTCPDFRVRHGSNIVAIEVKTIEGQGLFTNVRVGDHGFRPMDKALKPLREKIHAAARQLKPLASSGISLVILLANPHNRPVPFSAELLISAMYGDPAYQFASTGGTGSTGSTGSTDRMLLDRNGKLTNDHPYISAVALIREKSNAAADIETWYAKNRHDFSSTKKMIAEARRLGLLTGGTTVAVDLIDTVTDTPRVPPMFLNGPDDRRWAPTADGSGIERVQ